MHISRRRWLGLFCLLLAAGTGWFVFASGREVYWASQASTDNRPADAARHYLAAAGYFPWQSDLWIRAGQSAFEAGDYALAVQCLTRPEAKQAISANDLLTLGDAYARLGDSANAQSAWRRALDNGASGSGVYARLIQIHQQGGDYMAEAEDRKALTFFEPANAQNYFRLGELLCALDPPAAPVYLEQAAALDAALQPAASRLQEAVEAGMRAEDPAFAFLQTGRALAAAGSWDLAGLALENSITRSPQMGEAWAFLAEVYQQRQPPDFARAQTALEKSTSLDPDSLAVNALFALFWQRQGKMGSALPYLENAARLEPANPLWLVSIGQVKGYLGDLPEAETYYRSAIRLAPLQADYHRLLAEFCIQYQIKLDQTALPAAREALRLAPQDPANQDVLGQVLFITGDRAGALQAYQAALALDEQYAPANLHLGVLYSEMGETSLAFELLQRAHSSSTDPAIQDQAARLLAYFFP